MLAAGMAKRYGGCKPLAPLGVHGEAIIDLTASDALAAGFGRIVLVVGPSTSAALRYHMQRTWPAWAHAVAAEQPLPLGTAHAVLCARGLVGEGPFAVVNSDDVYGVDALTLLAKTLAGGVNVMVAFALAQTVLTDEPVTRGVCMTDGTGKLTGLAERRKVTRHEDGTFTAGDGLEPARIDSEALVSMNLWGFQPGIWALLEEAVRREHPEIAPDGTVANTTIVDGSAVPASDEETLLPEVVGEAVRTGSLEVELLAAEGRCVGVTHADDLPVARSALARMVGRGERGEWLWEKRL
jgi:hypothetical protein